MTAFEERKRKVLASLSQPADIYTDASPKGSVDEGIRELVDEINRLEGFVTTSSCAGRIAVYQEGFTGTQYPEETGTNTDTVSTSAGGKGGGQWLYVSHDAVKLEALDSAGDVLRLFLLPHDTQTDASSAHGAFVHLKFEPMVSSLSSLVTLPDPVKILHVLCSSLDNARRLLGAALSSGFRESGISSINNDHDMVLVAIRTNGLAFDSVIASSNSSGEVAGLLVTEQYLRKLIGISNQRFQVNELRKGRFRTAFFNAISSGGANGRENNTWEPADVRRARKQAEGLAKQQELVGKLLPSSTNDYQQGSTENEPGLEGMLMFNE